MRRPGYLRLSFRVPAQGEETLTAELWRLGTLGAEVRREPGGTLALDAWFSGPAARRAAAVAPREWLRLGAELAAGGEEEEREWMAICRARLAPFAVGRRLWIDPREPGASVAADPAPVPPGRRLLRLPARQAFGTGGHESTALALRLLEEESPRGRTVLDVGCGTGVLAFAALLGGARFVVALDADPSAAFAAAENRRLNRLFPGLLAGTVGALAPRPRFDLAVVNVLPAHIRPHLRSLSRLLAAGASAIVSGLLESQVDETAARLEALGLRPSGRLSEAGWAALSARRDPA